MVASIGVNKGLLQNAAAPTVQINYNMCNLERKAVICRYWDLLEKSVYLNIFLKTFVYIYGKRCGRKKRFCLQENRRLSQFSGKVREV
jgi:hypothetical protein